MSEAPNPCSSAMRAARFDDVLQPASRARRRAPALPCFVRLFGGAALVLSCSSEASTGDDTAERKSLASDAGALDASDADGAASCGSLDAGVMPARADVRRGAALTV